MACPASVFGPQEDRTSEYAEEGTAAHQLAVDCRLLGISPAERIGEKVNGFEVTQEMADAVQIYLDTIEAEIRLHEDQMVSQDKLGDVCCSLELTLEHPALKDFGGTTDCAIWSPGLVTVVDFKYGAGVAVEAEENLQLVCYASLVTECLDLMVENYRLIIVQPRKEHPKGPVRIWRASTLLTIRDLSEMIKQRIWNIEHAPGVQITFEAGDHCRWCPRKVHCPELHRLTVETAKAEFADAGTGAISADMTPDKAAELLSVSSVISDYLDSIRQWAHGQMDKGVPIPGFKLVHAFANRAWSVDEETILKGLKRLKIQKKDAFETKLKSPAQLEKVAGKEFVNSVTERALKGTTVVPESDNRPAVVRQSARDEFANLE